MTKASDNAFPSVLLTEGGPPTAPAAGKQRLWTNSSNLNMITAAGVQRIIGGAAAASALLAVKTYAPATDTVVGATTTSATLVDADATNAAITFTAPASTNVLVRLSAVQSGASASYYAYWGLREATSIIGTQVNVGRQNLVGIWAVATIYLAGIAAGSHTYKWGIASGNAGQACGIYGGPTYGQIVMEVWAAP